MSTTTASAYAIKRRASFNYALYEITGDDCGLIGNFATAKQAREWIAAHAEVKS